jgi:hypothetical protein
MRVVFILLFAAVVHVVGTDSSYKAFFVVIAFLIVLKTILGWRWIACSRATIARIANRLAVPEIGAGEIQGASSVGVEDVACRCKPLHWRSGSRSSLETVFGRSFFCLLLKQHLPGR